MTASRKRSASEYEKHRANMAKRVREQSAAGREIGDLPLVADEARRQSTAAAFRAFCDIYLADTFTLPWSPDHVKVAARIETAVLQGGLFAMAMPRGSGKTTLCEAGAIWSLLHGHRKFVVLIGSDTDHALGMLESIATELENNDLLAEDFPEVTYPIRRLEGIHQRATGQTQNGERTHIDWTADTIVLPTIGGSIASGSRIQVAGITGRIRGMKAKTPGGQSIRPDLVLIDDPQTDESARSPSQCATRERILSGAVLGLAGPGKKIAGLMTLTVVAPDDLAERMLDRKKHPAWQGERTRMVDQWPTNERLWLEYADIRRAAQSDGCDANEVSRRCNEFYAVNREAMDAGGVVAWAERKEDLDLSAIQHAWNLRIDRKDSAFFAEYQNDPMPENLADAEVIQPEHIVARVNGLPRGRMPVESSRLTAFIDVQGKALYWLVAAWGDGFSGAVIDYGAYPDQRRAYYTLADIKRTIQQAHPKAGSDGSIYAALDALTGQLLTRDWQRDDGSTMRIERCLIDANWGESTNLVYQFCRQSKHAAVVMPSHGRYVGASSRPFSEYTRKPGDRVGLNWRVPVPSGRAVRHVAWDTNFWKSFIQARLSTAIGDPGALVLFQPDREAGNHQMLAEHLAAEHKIRTQGRGRQVDEWKLIAGRDNHLLDCLVGAAVAANMQGVTTLQPQAPVVRPKPRKRVAYL